MHVRKTQWILKGIAGLLVIALLCGLVAIGLNLSHQDPVGLSGNMQDIWPESDQAVTGQPGVQ